MPEKRTVGAMRWMMVICPALIYLACRWTLRISGGMGWTEAAGTGLLLAASGAYYLRQFRPEPVPGRKILRTVPVYCAFGLAAGWLLSLIPGTGNPVRSAAAVLLLCVLGPTCEETVYRGLVFGSADQVYGFVPALMISTVLFAAGHGTLLQAALAVPAGLILGLIRKREGNLLAPAVFHAALNAAALIFAAQAG